MAIEQYSEVEEELLLVIKWLTDEFGLEVDPRTIHRVAMEEWALFDRAKVRLYVCTISWRLARLRLLEHLQGVRSLDDGVAAYGPSHVAPSWFVSSAAKNAEYQGELADPAIDLPAQDVGRS